MKVETFAEAYVEELNTAYLNWTNSIDIDGVKQIFTDEALETFAKPMYQVLSIKKQYGQLINFEKQLNFDSGFHDLQESMLDVDKNLLQLELVVEKYGKKCKDCSESNVLLKRMIGKCYLQSVCTLPVMDIDFLCHTCLCIYGRYWIY